MSYSNERDFSATFHIRGTGGTTAGHSSSGKKRQNNRLNRLIMHGIQLREIVPIESSPDFRAHFGLGSLRTKASQFIRCKIQKDRPFGSEIRAHCSSNDSWLLNRVSPHVLEICGLHAFIWTALHNKWRQMAITKLHLFMSPSRQECDTYLRRSFWHQIGDVGRH